MTVNSAQTRCIKQRSDKFLAPCQILVACPDYTSITTCNSECVKLDFLGSCDPRVCVFWYDTNNFHDKSISKFSVVTMFVFFGTAQIISMTGWFLSFLWSPSLCLRYDIISMTGRFLSFLWSPCLCFSVRYK